VVDERSVDIVQLIAKVWESWSLLEVNVFSWELFQDRIPTRQNLF